MTQRRVEADDYQDETSLEGEDDVETRDNELRIFDENHQAFLTDILGVRSRSVPPPFRDQNDLD